MKKPRRHIPGIDRRAEWGRFSPSGDVFEVLSTDTPRPWANLMSNRTYGAFFSQHGLGFSFHQAPKIREMTRWSVNESRPSHFDAGRQIFIKDRSTGRFWAANPQPGDGHLYTDYICRHGLGWSQIRAQRNGVSAVFRFFIPEEGDFELWTVTLKNRSARPLDLAVATSVELPTRSAYMAAHGRYDKLLKAARCFQPGDRKWGRRDTHLFFGLDRRVTAWDISRDTFLGPTLDPRRPGALIAGLTNSNATNEWMVAALETGIRIQPGKSVSFNAVLGEAALDSDAAGVLSKCRQPGAAERQFERLRSAWERKLRAAKCDLPDKNIARFLSVWGKYAVEQNVHLSRGQSVGYRDAFQDLAGYVHVSPDYVRERLLWLLGFVRTDGSSLRAIDITGHGNHDFDDFRDNPLWACESANVYVRETGDIGILEECVPYMNGGAGTVYDHLARICNRLLRLRGRHGLILVGGGDWNDALGPFGREGRGESAWLTLLLIRALRMLADLAAMRGNRRAASALGRKRNDLAEAFNRSAWDGKWYVYGWDDDGAPIGSRESPEGKIYANVQTWALMEDIVPPDREATLWHSLREFLLTDAGILVCAPPYLETNPKGARVRELGAGWYENASAYCHGTCFYIAACAARGKGDWAVEAFNACLPTNPANPRCDCEPFGITNCYVGPDSSHFGRAPHSWFTATPAWLLFSGWHGILGILPGPDGILLRPCVPSRWKHWTATRVWGNAVYNFSFSKPEGASGREIRGITVDGKSISGKPIPRFRSGTHDVDVFLA